MRIKRAFIGQKVVGPSLEGAGIIKDFYLNAGRFHAKIKMHEGYIARKPVDRICPFDNEQTEETAYE